MERRPRVRRRGLRPIPLLLLGAVLACAERESAPTVELPPVDAWPSPNPDMNLLEWGRRVGMTLDETPAPVDELEFTDGRTALVAVVKDDDDEAWIEVWMEGEYGLEHRRIDRTRIAEIRPAGPDAAAPRRLAHLYRVETEVEQGIQEVVEAEVPARAPAPDPARPVWELEAVERLADLPGAADVRWWPGQVTARASSALEERDAAGGRTGIWALLTNRLGHDRTVGLQVTIEADRLTFDHSPGYWGAPMEELHGHWRLYVDERMRWEYFANLGQDLPQGRFAYETTTITLGPGQHLVRWELQGCDTVATYFWAIDTISWQGVIPPRSEPAWGAIPPP